MQPTPIHTAMEASLQPHTPAPTGRKAALVLSTGGARGIGAGIVEQLAGKGHNVAFCGRGSAESAREVLEKLRSRYAGKFQYYSCDVSVAEDRKRLVDSFLADFGCIDVLVNNAGQARTHQG